MITEVKQEMMLNISSVRYHISSVAAQSASKSERATQQSKTFTHFKDMCYSGSQECKIYNSEERQFNIYDRVDLLW